MNLQQFTSVKRMLGELKLLTRSKNTEKTYLKGLVAFARIFNINDFDEFVEKIKNGELDANEVYRDFVVELASINLAPKSVNTWAASLKKFFSANGIELDKRIPIKVYNVHEDYLPSKEDLRKVLDNSPIRTKAIILMLASSGLRVDELRNLKFEDLELDKDPVVVRVKGTKAKERKSRVTFISTEAKNALLNYIEKRKQKNPISSDSFVFVTKRGDQMSYQNLQFVLRKALNLVARKEGKRFNLHGHSLRKFFKTQMISAGVPGPIVDRLVGHKRYLAEEYELYTEEQLRKWYLRAEKNLLIYTEGG